MNFRTTLLSALLLLGGCDLDTLLADPKAIQKEADAKAIGGACRHGLRSIEDCYSMNEKASKAAIFAGWKDMDQYMRDNKIDGVEPKGLKQAPVAAVAAGEELVPSDAEASAADKKAMAKSESKSDSKSESKSGSKSKSKTKPAENG